MDQNKPTWKEFKYLVASDLYRYGGKKNLNQFIKHYQETPGFKYSF